MHKKKGNPTGITGKGKRDRQKATHRLISTNSYTPLLLAGLALLLALGISQSVMAGSISYICKDNTTAYSVYNCKGHGGVVKQVVSPLCGDGILDVGEACDNGPGNTDLEPDSCRTDCRLTYCGDGVIDRGEQCDDGSRNLNNLPNTCRANCTLPVCGDGIVDDSSHQVTGTVFSEACDDGNTDNSDGCTTECNQCLPLAQMGNIEITTSTDLCPAEYHLDDYGDYGAIIIKASGVTLNCNGATLIGEGRGVGIVDFRSNDVTIKNCRIRGYDVGIRIQDARNVTLQGNGTCDNGQRNIELVDATDIHGYSPTMAPITACMDKQVPKPDIAKHAVVPPASKDSRGKPVNAPSASARLTHEGAGKPIKALPMLAKQQSPPVHLSTVKPKPQLLYRLAEKAQWRSKSANVVYGSDRIPETGSVRLIEKGQLADGHLAVNLLYTQPDQKKDGFIQGIFPVQKFADGTHLQATAALLRGANPADVLSFDIIMREGKRNTVVKQQRLRGSQRVALDIDLSRWQGKSAQLILRVRQLKGGKPSPAVWVNPILVNIP